MDEAQQTVLKLIKTSTDYINNLPEKTRLVEDELKALQRELTELQTKCKLECLGVEKKYHNLRRPILARLQDLVSGTRRRHNSATPDGPVPSFWRTVLSNHPAFHDLIEEHDRDVLGQLTDVRVEYLDSSDPIPGPGYRLLFEFGPNKYFENQLLTKTYQYDGTGTGCLGDLAYVSAIGTQIRWKKGMNLTERFNGNLRFSFFHFFDPLTREEIAEVEAGEPELLEEINDEVEDDYQLGATLKDQILPHAIDWFTGRFLTGFSAPLTFTMNARQSEVIQPPKQAPKYEYRAILRTASTEQGHSLLFLGSQHGNTSVVKLLLERRDVDVNSQNEAGETPMHVAAQNCHESVIKLLLDADGMDVKSVDNNGRTPLYIAAQNGHTGVVKTLIDVCNISVNSPAKDGTTPLFIAAHNGHQAVVKVLIGTEGINVNLYDNKGRTPLHIATNNGHEAVVTLLIGADGVDINSTDNDGRTPVYIAAQIGHEAVTDLLTSVPGIDVNSSSKDGSTPLFIAAYNGHKGIVKLLIGINGIDLSRGWEGWTPHSVAVQRGHTAIAKMLEPTLFSRGFGRWPFAAESSRNQSNLAKSDKGPLRPASDSSEPVWHGGRKIRRRRIMSEGTPK